MADRNDKISDLQVLKNASGQFYIGRTITYVRDDGSFAGPYPYSRESLEYWGNERQAQMALDNDNYTVRKNV